MNTIIKLLSVALLVGSLGAYTPTPVSSLPHVDQLLLEVSDMQASIDFYQDMLGLHPRFVSFYSSQLEADNVSILLSTSTLPWQVTRSKSERIGMGIYPHLQVANVGETVARLKKAGYTIVQEPREYEWGTEAFVADPDGYTWALFSGLRTY